MKNPLFFIFTLFSCWIYSQNIQEKSFSGIISVKNGNPIAYEINIFEEKGIVNGFSITDKGGKNETKSDISGIFNRNTKTYKLKETQVLSTKSEADLNIFCYINMTVKEKGKFQLKRYEGTFVGLFTNGDTCAYGDIVLMEKERLEKITKKLEKEKQEVKQKIKNTDSKIKKTKKEVLSTKVLKEGEDMYIQWNSDILTIYIWDANTEDGDKINLSINDKTILSDYITRKKRKKVKHILKTGENKIKIEAINVGENPPNTSRIELVDSKTKYPVITQLEQGKSTIITIVR